MYWYIFTFLVGFFVGFLVAALCAMAGQTDSIIEQESRRRKNETKRATKD